MLGKQYDSNILTASNGPEATQPLTKLSDGYFQLANDDNNNNNNSDNPKNKTDNSVETNSVSSQDAVNDQGQV